MADCLLIAAVGPEERLATSDPHLLDVAVNEAVDWIALPDSLGRRHDPRAHRD